MSTTQHYASMVYSDVMCHPSVCHELVPYQNSWTHDHGNNAIRQHTHKDSSFQKPKILAKFQWDQLQPGWLLVWWLA